MAKRRQGKSVNMVAVALVITVVMGAGIVGGAVAARAGGGANASADMFEGGIVSSPIVPGTYRGLGVYDKDCIPVGKTGLTRCEAGIQTKELGLVQLAYVHDMQKYGCLTQGDQLELTIVDANGLARVRRDKT